MPWKSADFVCPRGHVTDDVFPPDTDIPDTIACRCGYAAQRRRLHAVRVVGPVWEGLERFENALIPTHERRLRHEAGLGPVFRTARDIDRWYEEHNLRPLDPHEHDFAVAIEQEKDIGSDLERIARTDGADGVAERNRKDAVQEETGWDDITYSKWKEASDAAERAIVPVAAA